MAAEKKVSEAERAEGCGVLRVSWRDQGAPHGRKTREGAVRKLPQRVGAAPCQPGARDKAGHGHGMGSLREVPQGAVCQLYESLLAPPCQRREIATYQQGAQPVLGQADDGSWVYQGARPDEKPSLDAYRSVRRRPGLWRQVRSRRRAGIMFSRTGKVWDILQDKEPGTNAQKPFRPQTATAANPVCFQCKISRPNP